MIEGNTDSNRTKIIENELESLYAAKTYGAQIRSSIKWVEEGEKNTKFFLNLEKDRQIKKSILKLYNKNGNILTNQTEILQREMEFYENLYKSKNPDKTAIDNYIRQIEAQTLNHVEVQLCEGLLTEKECYDAITSMKQNKSPGSDGLTIEFYQTFWPAIHSLLISSLNSAYELGKLSNSQRKSVLSLMFKKGDSLDINN